MTEKNSLNNCQNHGLDGLNDCTDFASAQSKNQCHPGNPNKSVIQTMYEYKNTGIEWLGNIPKHWKTRRIKTIAKVLKTGSTPTTGKSEYFEDGTIFWYGPESFNGFMELTIPKNLLNVTALEDNEIRLFEVNSVFVVGIGATIGKVGIINKKSSCNQQINVITPYEWHEGKFIAYYLKMRL